MEKFYSFLIIALLFGFAIAASVPITMNDLKSAQDGKALENLKKSEIHAGSHVKMVNDKQFDDVKYLNDDDAAAAGGGGGDAKKEEKKDEKKAASSADIKKFAFALLPMMFVNVLF